MSVYRGYEGARVNVRFVPKADSCTASAAIAGKRVYNLGGFKEWADSGGEVEK